MICVVFLLNICPNFDSIVTFFMTDRLKFSTSDLANFATVGTFCYIVGLVLYSYYFKNIKPSTFYITTNFILWFINVSFLLVVLGTLERIGINVKFFCMLS